MERHAAEGQQQTESHSHDQLPPKGPPPCMSSVLGLASVLVSFHCCDPIPEKEKGGFVLAQSLRVLVIMVRKAQRDGWSCDVSSQATESDSNTLLTLSLSSSLG